MSSQLASALQPHRPLLSARKADWWDRSSPRIQVHPKSHHQACTNGLCAKAKDLLLQIDPVTDMAMAMRGPRLALLLPHILLPGSLGLIGERYRYEQFKKKHFDYPKTSDPDNQNYCNYMMKERNMTNRTYCKPINTFIHACEQEIQAICYCERISNNIYESREIFSLTICELKTENGHRPCTYKEQEKTSKIRVACNEEHLPVHFEKPMQATSMSLEKIQTQLGHTSTGLPRPHKERKQGAALKPQVGTES
ncbi:protein ITFG3 [Platysternon megacephalum]|uniref:Protein ITFG3 n=1 Tax=Platysternon megacephalum TaxID=55544 RepID=A0A4D9DTB0_9SAUR|nr:protein ITFG3 [Platysternon megacephalum]